MQPNSQASQASQASQRKATLALVPQRGICNARSAMMLSWISLLPA